MPDKTYSNNDIDLVALMCLANKLNVDPTWDELRLAKVILDERGGKAAAAFLAACVPSPARDYDNLERERDRRRS